MLDRDNNNKKYKNMLFIYTGPCKVRTPKGLKNCPEFGGGLIFQVFFYIYI